MPFFKLIFHIKTMLVKIILGFLELLNMHDAKTDDK